jgi:hypothetical protein
MTFSVGQTVTNAITNELGQILRVVDIGGTAYVVSVHVTGSLREVEELWRPKELKELVERS